MALIKLCLEPSTTFENLAILDFLRFQLCFRTLDYLCNGKSEISNVCNAVEGHCLQAMNIVDHHANGRFDWIISEHQSVSPSRETIFILSGICKRFTFVYPVIQHIVEELHQFFNLVHVALLNVL